MAEIPLSKPQIIPEGEHYFTITASNYDDNRGLISLTLQDEEGRETTQRYNLLNDDGSVNRKVQGVFSAIVWASLNDSGLDSVKPEQLVGARFIADVSHEVLPKRNDPTQTITFVNLSNYRSLPDDLPF